MYSTSNEEFNLSAFLCDVDLDIKTMTRADDGYVTIYWKGKDAYTALQILEWRLSYDSFVCTTYKPIHQAQ